MKYIYRILGTFFILSGIFLNEWTIRYLSHGRAEIASPEKRAFLVLVEICLVVLGIGIIRHGKTVLQNMLLFFCAVTFTLAGLEIALRFVPPNLDTEAPVWIPYKYKMQNRTINKSHLERAQLNPYGFNDGEHGFRKSSGITRIAVLGDSFIWGSGVDDHVIWTHKLERLLNRQGVKFEILNWGKPGWSTLDEYRFLKSEGIKYDFDFLLVGYSINDPVMDGSLQKRFIYEGGVVDRFFVTPISYLFPNAISLFVDLINGFFNTYFDYGYMKWLENIYGEENLRRYEKLLKEMADFCRNRRIRLLFVMTPENHNLLLKERFDQVVGLFHSAEITYLNLYPDVYGKLHEIPNRKLWGNPADGHPGDMVTEVFAQSIYKYLVEGNYLNDGRRKK